MYLVYKHIRDAQRAEGIHDERPVYRIKCLRDVQLENASRLDRLLVIVFDKFSG